MSPDAPSAGLWQQLRSQMSQGALPYVLATGYTVLFSGLLVGVLRSDPRPTLVTDILFAFFLGCLLVLHKSKINRVYRLILALIVLLGVMPYVGTMNQFYMNVATQAGMFVVLSLGLNIVVGSAGLLDLGYIAFYAVGAYTWAIVSTTQAGQIFADNAAWVERFPIDPYWFFAFLCFTLVIGAITGVLLGLPVLRLRGDYLAIVTLGFGEVIRVLATNLDRPVNITNGAQGIKSIGRPPLFFEQWVEPLGLNRETQLYPIYFYLVVLLIVGLMITVVLRLSQSRIGRAWTAIREDETAAIAMGVPLVRMKLLAFATGASFAGVMGMIFASYQSFINPPTFDLIRSINILSMVILGGMGSIPGAILGAILVTMLNFQILPRLTTEMDRLGLPSQFDPAQYQRMIFGLLLIVMAIFRPEGILPEDRRRQELHGEDIDDLAEAEEEHQKDDIRPDVDIES